MKASSRSLQVDICLISSGTYLLTQKLWLSTGLRAVITLRDQTEEIVAESTTETNEECIAEATEPWAGALEAVGAAISRCAEEFVGPVYELTEELHLFIQSNNYKAFNAQNMVLNHFTEVSWVFFL